MDFPPLMALRGRLIYAQWLYAVAAKVESALRKAESRAIVLPGPQISWGKNFYENKKEMGILVVTKKWSP
jgi:hypothetical protein